MLDTFAAVFLLNLKRRPDRLAAALEELRKHDWPFAEPIIFPAVDGHALPIPGAWTEGFRRAGMETLAAGAWGCRASHLRILESCILNGTAPVLILEDDLVLCENFRERCERFLYNVPNDWDGLMLGGAHCQTPRQAFAEEFVATGHFTWLQVQPPRSGVVRCAYTHYTLAYAVRGRLLLDLYREWSLPSRIDQIDATFAEMQRDYRVYAPHPWLIEPSGSPSDISGRGQNNPAPTHVVSAPHKIWTGWQMHYPTDVQGWLFQGEPQKLYELARGKRVLEMGSYCGLSTIVMAQSAREVVAVDTFECTGTPGVEGNTQQRFLDNLARYGVADKVKVHRGFFADVLPKLDGSFDLIFIDGSHDEASVRQDIQLALPLATADAVLAFHDYAAYYPGVMAAVNASFAKVEIVTTLGIVRMAGQGR
ncbi:MAG TPA: class I SAM-dependent methyltransferase [Gemmataceae bacterium]|jgi:GR25 family glycosyltransferase involved in LPS biosynthesis